MLDGELEEAENALSKGQGDSPRRADATTRYGRPSGEAGQHRCGPGEAYEQLAEKFPDDFQVEKELLRFYGKQGKQEKLLATAKRGVERFPEDAKRQKDPGPDLRGSEHAPPRRSRFFRKPRVRNPTMLRFPTLSRSSLLDARATGKPPKGSCRQSVRKAPERTEARKTLAALYLEEGRNEESGGYLCSDPGKGPREPGSPDPQWQDRSGQAGNRPGSGEVSAGPPKGPGQCGGPSTSWAYAMRTWARATLQSRP